MEMRNLRRVFSCSLQIEATNQKSEELQQLRDKVTSLELAVHSSSEEKGQFEVVTAPYLYPHPLLVVPSLTLTLFPGQGREAAPSIFPV